MSGVSDKVNLCHPVELERGIAESKYAGMDKAIQVKL